MTARDGLPDDGDGPGGVRVTIPRVVIAGTHSGCGKTTITRGIMEALVSRGYTVQPFKVGPDFIDPTHHSAVCGRVSRNLDTFMMGEEGVRETFSRACRGADIAVIEGVMGMFDGLDGTDCASTAHVSRILSSPCILVTDVHGMSRSVHALLLGYSMFDPLVRVAGVIFNRVGSDRHRDIISSGLRLTSLGFVPRHPGLRVESRHLGLWMAHETGSDGTWGRTIEEHCDIEGIVRIAGSAPPILTGGPVERRVTPPFVRIGVAMDPAFCFYYKENLDILRAAGADLVFFSPLKDPLPPVDAVYLGGGYPELHAEELSRAACTAALQKAACDGMPVLGECGGLLYLCESLGVERTFPMAGVLPAAAEMTGKLQALDYVSGVWSGGAPLAPSGSSMRGHEFHYSAVACRADARFALRLSRGRGISSGMDGLYEHGSVGTYAHSHFSFAFAESFVRAARDWQRT
ncbi:MAG: cobyrinate a,c-diamide synthase [Methanolinea sp.]|nr:cobyrinate a,c-diamide synthase [Methanolinea sp.]